LSLAVDKEKTAEERRRRAQTGKERTWWKAPKGEAAKQLAAWTNSIEGTMAYWQRRWDNLTYYRYLTGRSAGPASFNYSPTVRPARANIFARGRWEPPRYNVIMQCSDALGARVYKERPFVQVCPIADFKARIKSKKLSRWLDGSFFDLEIWPIVEQAGEDARAWGTGFVKVDVDPITNDPRITRIIQDEVIIDEDENDSGKVKRLCIRIFANRDEMLAAYGNNPEAVEAIETAPKAESGLYFGNDIDYTNVIILREAWSLPRGSKIKGRYLLTIGDFALADKEWTRKDFPLAKLPFKGMSTSWFGMGMPEMALGLQREVDRQMAADWENQRRAAWPRILYNASANINPGSLGDKSNGLVPVTGSLDGIKFVFPPSGDPRVDAKLEQKVRQIKELFRMNDQATMGLPRRELSGTAIEKAEVVDDAAHLPQLQALEDFVVRIGYLLIEAGEQCKPTVRMPGRQVQEIKWEDVNIAQSSYSLRAFPVGRLSKDMATRQKQIDTWYAQGKISKETAMRLEQVPDVDGFMDLVNSSGDLVEEVLDLMIETGEYIPPTGVEDLGAAHEQAQSRYMYERKPSMKTPQDRLDLIMKYIVALEQLMDEASPPASAAAPGVGITPPMGAPAPGPAGLGGVPLPPTNAVPLAA